MNPPPLPFQSGPVSERIFGWDVARGFAILGLIFSNMPGFASADQYREMAGMFPGRETAERAGEFILEFLLAGKCVALLSFLLGVGLAMQQAAAERSGRSFVEVVSRRMGGLFLIGFLHILLLWWGDILCAYALLGFGLLLFHRTSAAVVRVVAILGMTLPVLLVALCCLVPAAPENAESQRQMAGMLKALQDAYQGGYGHTMIARMIEALIVQLCMLLFYPIYFGIMLLGYDSIRRNWFPQPGRSPSALWIAGGVLSVLLCAVAAVLTIYFPKNDFASATAVLLGLPGSFGFALLVLAVALRLPDHPAIRLVAAVGRTALSNYLLQSFCAAVVFHGWAFGQYGRLSYGQTLLVAAGIVAVQLAWPIWWLRYFRFGPMEYVWRLLTYGGAAGKMRLA